jgi:hypothetical protein
MLVAVIHILSAIVPTPNPSVVPRPRRALTVQISAAASDTRSLRVVITNISSARVKLPDSASLQLEVEGARPDHKIDTCYYGAIPLGRDSLAPGEKLSTSVLPDDLLWAPCISSSFPWGSRRKVVPANRYVASVTIQLNERLVSNELPLFVGGR